MKHKLLVVPLLAALISGPAVAVAGDVDTVKPQSKITHPTTGETYEKSKFNAKIRGWASDKGGAGLDDVQVALRMKLKTGKCKWFAGKWFVKRACGKKLWKVSEGTDRWWYYLNMDLPVSTGAKSKVARYTAFSRARDNEGNTESDFDLYRNMENFNIKRG